MQNVNRQSVTIYLMLSAAISFFMSIQELKRCLSTITPYMKYIFCVDGRFLGFDYPTPLSTDGSRELVMEYENTVLIDAPDLKEINKRQIYLDKTKEHDIDLLLVLDSDEFAECDNWSLFEEYCRSEYKINNKQTTQFGVLVENANTYGRNQFDPRPRIFANPWDIKHTDHRTFVTKSNSRPVGTTCVIEGAGFKLRHNYTLRHESYNELRLSYQKQLVESEEPKN